MWRKYVKDLNEEEDVKSARPDSGRRAYFCPSHKHMNSFKLFHLHGPIFCILNHQGVRDGPISWILDRGQFRCSADQVNFTNGE